MIQEVSQYLKNEHAEYILKKLIEIDFEALSLEDIDLIYEISRFSIKSENLTKKSAEFLGTLLFDEQKRLSNPQLNEQALNKYCDLMKSFDMREHRIGVIIDSLGQINKNKAVINSCKILKKIIDNYPTREPGTENYTQKSLIEFLCEKHSLMNICFEVCFCNIGFRKFFQ